MDNIGLTKPGKSSLIPIVTGRKISEQHGTARPMPNALYSGGSSPEVTKPILVRAKTFDSSEANSLRRENKENLSDNSEGSVYSTDSQSRKKTVTFGKNDVIQTHVEYMENMDRINGINNEVNQLQEYSPPEVCLS